MKKKKILAGLLVCALIGGAVPYNNYVMPESVTLTASAEEYTNGTYESLKYAKYSDHIVISSCVTFATEVVIPNEIEGLPVTSIGDYAFEGCRNLTSITIPDSVTSIEYGVFSGCRSLTSITIPDSVTSIGNYAFENCSGLTEIKIPDSVTSIGDYAFLDCSSLTEIKMPDGVTRIGQAVFSGCRSLTSITIPDGVTSIGDYAFSSCSALKSITIKNPECEIYDSKSTISNSYGIYEGIIYGYDNSTAQAYAEKYERNFVSLGEAPTVSSETLAGDANGDGTVDIADAVAIASYVSNPEKNSLSEQGIINGDVQGNGNGINANDALAVQQYLANITKTLPVD